MCEDSSVHQWTSTYCLCIMVNLHRILIVTPTHKSCCKLLLAATCNVMRQDRMLSETSRFEPLTRQTGKLNDGYRDCWSISTSWKVSPALPAAIWRLIKAFCVMDGSGVPPRKKQKLPAFLHSPSVPVTQISAAWSISGNGYELLEALEDRLDWWY